MRLGRRDSLLHTLTCRHHPSSNGQDSGFQLDLPSQSLGRRGWEIHHHSIRQQHDADLKIVEGACHSERGSGAIPPTELIPPPRLEPQHAVRPPPQHCSHHPIVLSSTSIYPDDVRSHASRASGLLRIPPGVNSHTLTAAHPHLLPRFAVSPSFA